MDNDLKKNEDSNKKNNKSKKEHSDMIWFIKIFITTFILSIVFSFISTNGISNLSLVFTYKYTL